MITMKNISLRISRQGSYWSEWQNEEFSTLLNKAKAVLNWEERMRLYMQADKILVEEAVIITSTYGRLRILIKPWVSKFPTSALKFWFWKDAILESH